MHIFFDYVCVVAQRRHAVVHQAVHEGDRAHQRSRTEGTRQVSSSPFPHPLPCHIAPVRALLWRTPLHPLRALVALYVPFERDWFLHILRLSARCPVFPQEKTL